MRTGTGGRPWVALEQPKPAPVDDRYAYWLNAPPELSAACVYWVRQIERGWLPNRRISQQGYDNSADWYGVWIWEYLHVLAPLIAAERERGSGA
ncbi:hypothetical protein [Nocardia puris]|uniref:Uncharacterized protein n=1 Tax=Nocardia puris TaxID=208602 RepID=A0A366CW78_9NOCA|nr:hypothetical protein [Nocardia puris]RBO82087.1 hypothetical protein DFR74_12542 [Nocardia puris]